MPPPSIKDAPRFVAQDSQAATIWKSMRRVGGKTSSKSVKISPGFGNNGEKCCTLRVKQPVKAPPARGIRTGALSSTKDVGDPSHSLVSFARGAWPAVVGDHCKRSGGKSSSPDKDCHFAVAALVKPDRSGHTAFEEGEPCAGNSLE